MADLPVSIRLNPFKLTAFEGTPVPWSRWGRILPDRPSFTLDPLFHAGAYYVQDSSAMFVGHIFRKHIKKGVRVLDLCAAPGGKTTDLAASLREVCGDDFLLVSNEVMKARLGVLRDNVARWGDPNVRVTSLDPAVLGRSEGAFDIIVADVPCSGEGMFRKDEKAVEQWSEKTVDLCAARQKRIIADVWPALKEGGILVYSTCTYNEKENDDNLQWAARELGGEILESEKEFGEYGVKVTKVGNLLKAGESLGEGQWVGAIRKTSAAGYGRLSFPLAPKKADGLDPDEPLGIFFDRDKYPIAEVDRLTALRYLHRDSFPLPDAPKGIVVISYKGHPLGFVKNLGTRCNNLLPQHRRILMDIK